MTIRATRKLAVVSDIHGNARALAAVLADIELRGIVDIVNLGDCAYGPFDPRPVLDELIKRNIPTVSGNEDRVLVEASRGISHSRTARFSADWLENSHLEWLAKLPTQLIIGDMALVHGIPGDDTAYLLTTVDGSGIHKRSTEEIVKLTSGITQRVTLCGHDHTPGKRALGGGQIIVNPGSVGCPAYTDDVPAPHIVENGSPHARYALLDLSEDSMNVEFVCVLYEWDVAAQEAQDNGFSDWARWIASGQAS